MAGALGFLFLAQAATAAVPPPPIALPDIEIRAQVRVDRLDVRSSGEARAAVTLQPGGERRIEVDRSQPPGAASYRNLTLDLAIEGRIGDPLAAAAPSADTAASLATGDTPQ